VHFKENHATRQTTLEQGDAGEGSGDRWQYMTTINGITVHVDEELLIPAWKGIE
jgi:hypothetical protein